MVEKVLSDLQKYPLLDNQCLDNILHTKTDAHEKLRQLILMLNGLIEEHYFGSVVEKLEGGVIVIVRKEETLKF